MSTFWTTITKDGNELMNDAQRVFATAKLIGIHRDLFNPLSVSLHIVSVVCMHIAFNFTVCFHPSWYVCCIERYSTYVVPIFVCMFACTCERARECMCACVYACVYLLFQM